MWHEWRRQAREDGRICEGCKVSLVGKKRWDEDDHLCGDCKYKSQDNFFVGIGQGYPPYDDGDYFGGGA